jgi:hypothetical protein
MSDLRCANCTYEVGELNEVDLCQTCERAYIAGYELALLSIGEKEL